MSPRDDNDPPPFPDEPEEEPMDTDAVDLPSDIPSKTQNDPPADKEAPTEVQDNPPARKKIPEEEQNDPPVNKEVPKETQDNPPISERTHKEEPLDVIDEYPHVVVKQERASEEVEDDADSPDLEIIFVGTRAGAKELEEARRKAGASASGAGDANDDDDDEPESDEDEEEGESRYNVIIASPIVDHIDEAGHTLGAFQRDETDYDPTVILPTPVHTSADKAADIDTHSVVPSSLRQKHSPTIPPFVRPKQSS